MLGSRIAALRRCAGLSQAELAQQLKISPSAVGMYEQGRREPSLDTVVALARTLGVSVDYLLTGQPLTQEDRQIRTSTVGHAVTAAEEQPVFRPDRPFTRQELATLFAALLMES